MPEMKKKLGAHLRRKVPNNTVQSKISTEPPMPCKKQCGREASANRKDGLCDNCAYFVDRGKRR